MLISTQADKITLIATTRLGLEAVVKRELLALGYSNLDVNGGYVAFEGTVADIPRANLWLRTVDRVRMRIGEFKALTFDELFEQTKALPWEEWIPEDGAFDIVGKSVKSKLFSIRSSQAIVKKAIAERLLDAHGIETLPETGSEYTVQISLFRDMATLSIDTTGAGLHKRGFREEAGEAPLKETLAASLVQLSVWNRDRLLVDPMCGSGTILIEAAMIGRNIAPGLQRRFVSEEWEQVGKEHWDNARREAIAAQREWDEPQLFGYDIDPEVLSIAKRNAYKAGVLDDITFEQRDVKDLWIDKQYGVVVTNPPYGVRLADFTQMNQIYIALHKTFRKKRGWSVFVLTSDLKFPDYFKRARPDRVRKLFNGPIEANYYQYLGERPPFNEPIEEAVPKPEPVAAIATDPLHGVKLADMLETLVEQIGWEAMALNVDIRCFQNNPSVKSSLKFLRRTPWARSQVEALYLKHRP